MLFKKLLCVVLGHKIPIENRPIVTFTTGLIKEHHYSWSRMPCERCISYEQKIKYTEQEFQKITQKLIDDYIATLEEMQANKILQEELPEDFDKNKVNSSSKLVH